NCIQSTASRRYTDRHSNQIAQHIDRCGNGLIHARGGMSTDHRPNISCLEILELRGLDTGIRTLLEYHPRSGRASALPAWGVVLIRERRIAGNDVDALGHAVRGNRDKRTLKAGEDIATERRSGLPTGVVHDFPDKLAVTNVGTVPRLRITVEETTAFDSELSVL